MWAGGCAKDVPLNSAESSLIKVNYIFIGFCSVIEIHWVGGALKMRLWIFMSMIRNMRLFRDNFPFPLARHRIDIVIIVLVVVVAFVALQCVATAWKGPLALWRFGITANHKWEWELDLKRAKEDLNWVVKSQIKAKLASWKVQRDIARKHCGFPRWLFCAVGGAFKDSSTIPETHQATYYIRIYRTLPAHSCQEVDTKNYCCIFDCLVQYLHIIPFSFFRLRTNFHILLLTSCTFLSMSFLTFCWFTLRWAAEVDAGRSSSIEELGFGPCFMGSEGDQEEEDCVGSSFCFCINARQEPPPAPSPSPPFAFLWSVLQLMECCSGCCSSPPCTSFCRHSLNPMRHAAFSIHVIPKPCPGVWTSALVQSSNRQMIPHSHLRPQLNPNSKFESESESLPKTTVHSQLGAGVALFHWNNKWCP